MTKDKHINELGNKNGVIIENSAAEEFDADNDHELEPAVVAFATSSNTFAESIISVASNPKAATASYEIVTQR